MDSIPDITPVSEFRSRQNELRERVSTKPILFTRHGYATAVLLGPEPYNELLEHTENLEFTIDAVEARRDTAPRADLGGDLADRDDRVPGSSDDQPAEESG